MTNTMLKTLALCGAALALSTQIAPAQDWAGTYVGAVIGYGSGDSNHIDRLAYTGAPAIYGSAVGVTLGHDFSAGNVVYGVEFDAAALGLDGLTDPGRVGSFGCAAGCQTQVQWLATLRARVGVAQGKMLWFGTAGFAMGGVEAALVGEAYTNEGTQTATGWTLGAGAEHKVNDHLSIKGEVLYTDLGQTRYDDMSFEPGFYVDVDFTQLRLGLNYRY